MTPDFVWGFCAAIALWGAIRAARAVSLKIESVRKKAAESVQAPRMPRRLEKLEWLDDEDLKARFDLVMEALLPDEQEVVRAWAGRYDSFLFALLKTNGYTVKGVLAQILKDGSRPIHPDLLPRPDDPYCSYGIHRDECVAQYKVTYASWSAAVQQQRDAAELAWLRELAGREGVK